MEYGVLHGSEESVVVLMKGCLAGYNLSMLISLATSQGPLDGVMLGGAVLHVLLTALFSS